jgi:endo-1,4-beta-mannosidase
VHRRDQVRQHYAAAWVCELAGTFGKPVVLEEFGVSSDFVSDENAAHYYRQVLHNSLLAGSRGWIGWNNADYDDLAEQDPYRHHAFEMHFGLTDRHGDPKPALAEFAAFAAILDRVDIDNCGRADTDAVLVVSSYLDTEYPFTERADRTYVRRAAPVALRPRRSGRSRSGWRTTVRAAPGAHPASTTRTRSPRHRRARSSVSEVRLRN